MKSLVIALLLMTGAAHAQWISVVGSKPGGGAATCQNWTVLDWSGGTNGVQPTPTTLANSSFNLPAGASYSVVDSHNILTYATVAHMTPFLTTPPCITGTVWPNTSTLGLSQANGLNEDNVILALSPNSTQAMQVCVPFYTTIPQNAAVFGRMDSIVIDSPFIVYQISGNGSSLQHTTELQGTPTVYPGNEFFGPTFPTNTQRNICTMLTPGSGSTQSQGTWDASGNYIAGSGFTTPNGDTYGGVDIKLGDGVGAPAGPAGTFNYFGTMVAMGIGTTPVSFTFPMIPGYQLVPPIDSPGPGNYPSAQSITLTSPGANAPSPSQHFYSLVGTATCGSTLYTGAISLSSTTTLSAVDCLSGFVTSPTLTSTYTFVNALGWWPINEGGAATTALDASGNSHNGTWAGTKSCSGSYYTTGHVLTSAGCFDGSTNYIEMATFPTISSNKVTASAWVNLGSTTRADLATIWTGGTANSQFDLIVLSGVPKFFISNGSTNNNSGFGATTLSTGTWYHVCGGFDGTSISIYLDGVLQSSLGSALTLNTSSLANFRVGNNSSGDGPTTGDIEDVRIFNVGPAGLCSSLFTAGPQS